MLTDPKFFIQPSFFSLDTSKEWRMPTDLAGTLLKDSSHRSHLSVSIFKLFHSLAQHRERMNSESCKDKNQFTDAWLELLFSLLYNNVVGGFLLLKKLRTKKGFFGLCAEFYWGCCISLKCSVRMKGFQLIFK